MNFALFSIGSFMLFFVLFSSSFALASDCEKQWLSQQTTATKTKSCLNHWLTLVYGQNWTLENLELDPARSITGPKSLRVAELQRAHKRFQALRKGPLENRANRVLEGIDYMLDHRTKFQDVTLDGFPFSYQKVIFKAMSGQKLLPADLQPHSGMRYTASTLRIVRNAVYARHGRAFKSKDLATYFYGPDAKYRFKNKLPKVNPTYTNTLLTSIDKANASLLKKAEKAAKQYEQEALK